MDRTTKEQRQQIAGLYRAGATGFDIANLTGVKMYRVYAILRQLRETGALTRRRKPQDVHHRLRCLAGRWLDALPRLRRGVRVRMMTSERRAQVGEQLEEFLFDDTLRTHDAGFLEMALAFSEVRCDSFVVNLARPELHGVVYPRLLIRADLVDLTDPETEVPPITCVISKGEGFGALEAEIALLAMNDTIA